MNDILLQAQPITGMDWIGESVLVALVVGVSMYWINRSDKKWMEEREYTKESYATQVKEIKENHIEQITTLKANIQYLEDRKADKDKLIHEKDLLVIQLSEKTIESAMQVNKMLEKVIDKLHTGNEQIVTEIRLSAEQIKSDNRETIEKLTKIVQGK